MGAADTGAQQIGALTSRTGRAFGMTTILRSPLTYVEEVGNL